MGGVVIWDLGLAKLRKCAGINVFRGGTNGENGGVVIWDLTFLFRS